MKKICIVSTTGSVINAFMLKHIEYLKKEYKVIIILGDDSNIRCNCEIKRIDIKRKINILEDIKSLYNLCSYFKSQEFDVVFSIMPKSGLLAMLAAFFANTKMRLHFFTGQVWATKSGLFRQLLKSMDKVLVKSSTHILVDSISQKEFLVKEKITTNEKASVLNKGSISGVNLDRFKSLNDVKNKLRTKYNFTSEDKVFMFLGRINRDKGISELSKLFLVLFKKYNNIKLVLIGPIEDEELKKEIYELLINKNVISKFEFINNPEYMLNLADVLVLPSHREGFGTVVIEAAAMGIPTIGSNIYGLSDAIINNETGIFHAVNDIEDMVVKYSNLIENKILIRRLGSNAQGRAFTDFNDDDISKLLLNFIKDGLDGKR